jgi:hypothetical protein
MQAKPARQLLQVMKVVATRSLGPEPRRLWDGDPGAEVNLDKLGRGGHDEARFYQFAKEEETDRRHEATGPAICSDVTVYCW